MNIEDKSRSKDISDRQFIATTLCLTVNECDFWDHNTWSREIETKQLFQLAYNYQCCIKVKYYQFFIYNHLYHFN